ncbi:MAG TPA: Lrp/AsnC family transcriptional regulator [Pseudonocardia sp.]|nr:Lrp/AsnC family transcriptional regulator [Pseudonocardia sp.]
MTSGSSDGRGRRPPAPQDVRPLLDEVDRAILRVLAADARIPNKTLAEQVGIAQSTCLARVRSLRERRVIRGFHADVDPRALGHDLQAMIAVRLHPHARGTLSDFAATMSRQPEVLDVYFVAGANDYLLHVATASTDALRWFVAEHLNRNRDVAHTETSLIFEHVPAAGRHG